MESLLSSLSQDEIISLGETLGLELKSMTKTPGSYAYSVK